MADRNVTRDEIAARLGDWIFQIHRSSSDAHNRAMGLSDGSAELDSLIKLRNVDGAVAEYLEAIRTSLYRLNLKDGE